MSRVNYPEGWTRAQPTKNGRYWCAVKYSDTPGYVVKLVSVFGCDSKTVGPHATPFWGGAYTLRALKRFDILWSVEPLQEPEPPAWKVTNKKLKSIEQW